MAGKNKVKTKYDLYFLMQNCGGKDISEKMKLVKKAILTEHHSEKDVKRLDGVMQRIKTRINKFKRNADKFEKRYRGWLESKFEWTMTPRAGPREVDPSWVPPLSTAPTAESRRAAPLPPLTRSSALRMIHANVMKQGSELKLTSTEEIAPPKKPLSVEDALPLLVEVNVSSRKYRPVMSKLTNNLPSSRLATEAKAEKELKDARERTQMLYSILPPPDIRSLCEDSETPPPGGVQANDIAEV